VAEGFYLTKASSWKGAAEPEDLARLVKERGLPFRTYPRVRDALRAAIGPPDRSNSWDLFDQSLREWMDKELSSRADRVSPEKEIVCITGSHYVVGEAMGELGIQP
jgi:hypothetical protein